MSSNQEYCKHNNITRNCYSCHLEHTYPKSETDTLHEKLTELTIRINKLEQYKRLQDDENNRQKKINNFIFDRFGDIENLFHALKK